MSLAATAYVHGAMSAIGSGLFSRRPQFEWKGEAQSAASEFIKKFCRANPKKDLEAAFRAFTDKYVVVR